MAFGLDGFDDEGAQSTLGLLLSWVALLAVILSFAMVAGSVIRLVTRGTSQ